MQASMMSPGGGLDTYTLGPITMGMENNDIDLGSTNVTFQVVKASGGWIVRVSERLTTRSGELHIIPDGADFSSELGKIITMSCLKGS